MSDTALFVCVKSHGFSILSTQSQFYHNAYIADNLILRFMAGDDKMVIGLTEEILVRGTDERWHKVVARIDTGATKSSIDQKLAEELSLGPVIKNKMFRSAHGKGERPIVSVAVRLCGKEITKHFSVIDRGHMKYRLLIGQNILKHGFLIDPSRQ